MKRRIIIELEGDEQVVNEITVNIEATAIGQMGCHEISGYGFHKEILPEGISGGIQLPVFMNGERVKSPQEKAISEALHGRGVTRNG